jgi:hypothetical protein
MKTMFFHGLTTDSRRFTVSGKIEEDGNTLAIGIAICGAKERFVRKTGRIKSESRLNGANVRGIKEITIRETEIAGNELKIFYQYVADFCKKTSKELQKDFNLDNNDRSK